MLLARHIISWLLNKQIYSTYYYRRKFSFSNYDTILFVRYFRKFRTFLVIIKMKGEPYLKKKCFPRTLTIYNPNIFMRYFVTVVQQLHYILHSETLWNQIFCSERKYVIKFANLLHIRIIIFMNLKNKERVRANT